MMQLIEYRDALALEFYPWHGRRERIIDLLWSDVDAPVQGLQFSICYHVTQHGRRKVHAVLLPRTVDDDTLAFVEQLYWVIVPRPERGRKLALIVASWDIPDNLAVYATIKGDPNRISIAEQTGEPTLMVEWASSDDLISVIRHLGPGICTFVLSPDGEDDQVLELAIDEAGQFASDLEQDAQIVRDLEVLWVAGPSSLIVRTFTDEFTTIADPAHSLRIIRVPIKEIRGFQIFPEPVLGRVRLHWNTLDPAMVREAFMVDASTGRPIVPPSDRDHRYC